MICKNCGKTIPDGSIFCPQCGTRIEAAEGNGRTETKTSDIGSFPGIENIHFAPENNSTVVPCPYCGSTDIVMRNRPSYVVGVGSIVVSFFMFLIRFASGSTAWWTLLGIGFLFWGIIKTLEAKVDFKEWNSSKWNLRCNTCNKNFTMDPPDGSHVITNIRQEGTESGK